MIMSNIGICAQEHWDAQERIELNKGVFPKNFSKAIDAIQYDLLGIERGKSHVKVIDNNTLYINLSFSLKNSVQQGDWYSRKAGFFTFVPLGATSYSY